jgi:hypothetical protein
MDKDARIARLQARLVAINYERAAIDAEIAALTSQEQMEAVETNNGAAPGALDRVLTANEKIALFRSLFRGRADVFPVRWENPKNGKSGYSPACDNEWRKGLCGKPKIKCSGCPNQGFIAISDDLIKQHLRIGAASASPFCHGCLCDAARQYLLVPGRRFRR